MDRIVAYTPVSFTGAQIDFTRGYARAFVSDDHVRRLSEGHFPNRPFVPGAYVLDFMVALAQDLLKASGRHPHACRIEQCSFLLPVKVGLSTMVEIEFHVPQDGPIHGRVSTGTGVACRARF